MVRSCGRRGEWIDEQRAQATAQLEESAPSSTARLLLRKAKPSAHRHPQRQRSRSAPIGHGLHRRNAWLQARYVTDQIIKRPDFPAPRRSLSQKTGGGYDVEVWIAASSEQGEVWDVIRS